MYKGRRQREERQRQVRLDGPDVHVMWLCVGQRGLARGVDACLVSLGGHKGVIRLYEGRLAPT